MRKLLIAGNWKMNTDLQSAAALTDDILKKIEGWELKSEVLVCPPFTNLLTVSDSIQETDVKLGAQNCEYRNSGAYTGEVSPTMLKAVGCDYVIIGHSERRTYYGETDETVNLKAKAAFENGLTPIICIGETIEERNSGNTYTVLERQIRGAYKDLNENQLAKLVIAYEPVWAIGTGISATTEQAGEAHEWIRNFIRSNYNESAANIRILYGGSMNDKNAAELLALDDVDGGLIGGASLKAESFVSIISAAEESQN